MNILPAINFHLWKPCNFKCKFCFATFEDQAELFRKKSHLKKSEMQEVIDEIARHDIQKITFAGGEPMLCKWLDELIIRAKSKGLTTMIVTNGWFLSKEWLKRMQGYLDWVTISVDSLNHERQLAIGRANRGKTLSESEYLQRIQWIRQNDIRFKMNTVVNSVNWQEDMRPFIQKARPERWKLFQVLPIQGQSDATMKAMLIDEDRYKFFVSRHLPLSSPNIEIVSENNDMMTGSYLMLDPLGRLYDNVELRLRYSKPIQEVGLAEALTSISVSEEKFHQRGGLYQWEK